MTVVDHPIPAQLFHSRRSSLRKSHRRVAITNIGLVTPLGPSAGETWSALLAGKYIEDHGRCDIEATLEPRTVQLALRATREAMDSRARLRDLYCEKSAPNRKPTDGHPWGLAGTNAS